MRTTERVYFSHEKRSGVRAQSGRRVGGVLGALGLAFLLGACGEVPGDQAGASNATSAQLIALKQQISGTPAGKGAANFLAEHAVDTFLHECMASVGMPYRVQFVDTYVGSQSVSLGESWAFPLHDETVITNLQVWAEKRPEMLAMEEPPQKGELQATDGYGESLATCEKQVRWRDNEAFEPRDSENLGYQLYDLVTSTEASFGKVGVYDECMGQAGFDTVFEAEDFSGTAGLYQLIWGEHPDWTTIPEVGAEGGAAWADFETWANRVLDADAACREAKHYEVLSELGPLLEDFEQRNAQALADLGSGWAEVISEARAQGWVDQTTSYSAATN